MSGRKNPKPGHNSYGQDFTKNITVSREKDTSKFIHFSRLGRRGCERHLQNKKPRTIRPKRIRYLKKKQRQNIENKEKR